MKPSTTATVKSGPIPTFAHDWSRAGTGGHLRTHGRHFVDAYGRVCNLRGVNLSGCCKTPVNDDHDLFPGHADKVTFVGRPFPIEEAHEHLSRLKRWGLTFVRFLITWEAIEHSGPGIYDTNYLNYIRSLLSLFPTYGLTAFVSLHQDVWSRYSGGSGAPAWTLDIVGFDLEALEETGAAWLKGVRGGGHVEIEKGVWPCGYQKLAASTMATLFWAGDTFAPKLRVKTKGGEEVPVQQFLQDAFLKMWDVVVNAVGDLEGVLGFELMNEPHRGYIETKSLHSFDYNTDLHLHHVPSPLQSFQLGAGHPTTVKHWTRSFPPPSRHTGHELLNPSGKKAWRTDGPTGGKCLWEMHGVWGWDNAKAEGVVLRESYFMKDPGTGRKIDWYTDFYYPFVSKWANSVRRGVAKDKLVFLEAIPNEYCPTSWTADNQPQNMVFAPHWYDLNALFAKAFGDFTVNVQGISRGMFLLRTLYWGQQGARDNYVLQIGNIVDAGYKALGEKPIVIGECGIPMDMNEKEAFQTDDWTWQAKMMDALLTGLERSLVGFTLWNYNPSNTDQLGDDWNGENFSWFSRTRALPPSLLYYDQTSPTLDNGGRILRAIVRPYAAKTAGVPVRCDYEMTTGTFVFEWVNRSHVQSKAMSSLQRPPLHDLPPLTSRETEIFLPSYLTQGRRFKVEGLEKDDKYRYDASLQTLTVLTGDISSPRKTHRVVISLDPPPRPMFEVNDFWGDFGGRVTAVLVAILAMLVWLFLL
ncbi:glycoside hydrolase family 5 protein [Jaapia argillacea MUCL 33604]|uniref:Glycoside hydrolase family 5 protein n=1 Tax=Jaapia argillacea MUCL 33604 TaxID=933084 RepID=A0A067Q2C6_9AGAM|nr:glycoside hydrolase family 5 protein [Jaapia argillacea MUCL 33604]